MKNLTNPIYKSDIILSKVRDFIEEVVDKKLQNEQWFLNFLDDLNELSVKY